MILFIDNENTTKLKEFTVFITKHLDICGSVEFSRKSLSYFIYTWVYIQT